MIIISTPGGDIELTGEEEAAYLASLPGEVESFYRLSKLTLVNRLTSAEAEIVYPAMAEMPAKLRFVWDTAQSIESDSQFFDDLRGFLAQVLTPERADALLQPET